MIPLRDTLSPTRVPWMNRTLLGANIVVFFVQMVSGRWGEVMVSVFGFIPLRLFHPASFDYSWAEVSVTLATSLFLHGGVVHLVGNMIYLAIFGNDIEEKFGPGKYLVFYVACGAAGSLTHAFLFPQSTVPSVGASGSIAGILGAFLLIYPKARIITLFPLVVSWALAEVPAVVFLPIWFLLQFTNGWLSLASAQNVQEVAGVAWWAHVGGFSAGVIIALCAILTRSRMNATSAGFGPTSPSS